MVSPAAQRLAALLQRPEAAFNLPEAALVIASERYPDLQVQDYLSRIALASDQLRRRLAADASKTHTLALLNHFMFDELGYAGAGNDYYDARNSFLNEVMERRIGIPITLSILYMALGQRVGLPLAGVSFPGHFLVRCALDGGLVVLDPFVRGVSVSAQDLRGRLAAQGIQASEAGHELGAYLQAASNRAILARLLRNLLAIYTKDRQWEAAVRITDLILVVEPDAPRSVLTRARLFWQLECYPAALRDLEHYIRIEPAALQEEEVQTLLAQLKRSKTTLH